jgi:hypothetical protein
MMLSLICSSCAFPSHNQIVLDSNGNELSTIELLDEIQLEKPIYLKLIPPSSYEKLNAIEIHFPLKDGLNLLQKDSSFKFEKSKQVLMRFSQLDNNLEEILLDVKGFLKIKQYQLSTAQYDLDSFSSKQILFQYPINLQISNTGIDFNLDYIIHVQPKNLPPYRFQAEVLYALNKEDEGLSNQAYLESKYINNQKRLPALKSIQILCQNQNDSFVQNLKGIELIGIQNQQIISNRAVSDSNGLLNLSVFEDHLLYQKNQAFDLKFKTSRDELIAQWLIPNQDQNIWENDNENPFIYQLPLIEKLDEDLDHLQISTYAVNPDGSIENMQAWRFKMKQSYQWIDMTPHPNAIDQIEFYQDFFLNHPYQAESLSTLSPMNIQDDQENQDDQDENLQVIQVKANHLDQPAYFEKIFRFPKVLSQDHPLKERIQEQRILEIKPPADSIYQATNMSFDQDQALTSPFMLDLKKIPLKPIVQGKLLNLQQYGLNGISLEIKSLLENQSGTFDVFYPKILEDGQFNQALAPGEYVVIASQHNQNLISAPYLGYFQVKAEQKDMLLLKEFALLPAQLWRNNAVYLHDSLVEYLEDVYTEIYCDLSDIALLNPNSSADLTQKIKVFSKLSEESQIDLPVHQNLCKIEALSTF